MRDIVVHSPGYRTWHGSVRYAAQLASSVRATLTGLFIAPRQTPAPGPPKLAAEIAAYAQEDLHQAILAGSDFAAWTSQWGVRRSLWQVAIGQSDDVLALIGDWHDLVVLQGEPWPGLPAQRLVGGVVRSGTSCIVVPEGNIAPGCVVHAMVVWDGSAASSRAMHAALPLLRTAEAVSLLQQRAEHGGGRRSAALEHLRVHGIMVSTVETLDGVGGTMSDQVLGYAGDTRADLIVMGANGDRGPVDRFLGPVANGLLARSRLPVFLKS